MAYQKHETVPAFTRAVWEAGKLMNRDAALLLSGEIYPPAIGTEIVVIMNRIGPARVIGYFEEEGWLGILCHLHSPPDWHKRQNGDLRIGHIFGPEFKLASEVRS